jgi:murein DD-endopeptidase MepM/ murein hydrolase activator NlpD
VIKIKSTYLITLVIAVTFTGIWTDTLKVEASVKKPTIEDFLKDVQQDKLQYEEDLQNKKHQISELNQQEQNTRNEIKQLDAEVAVVNEELRKQESNINILKKEIENQENEINNLNELIEKRESVIMERLRTMQLQGRAISYIDVFLGVHNFGEFLDAANAASSLINADKEILEVHYQNQHLKKKKEIELQSKLASLDAILTKLELLKAEQQRKIDEKNSVMGSLIEDKEKIESELLDVSEVQDLIAAQENAILKELEARKNPKEVETNVFAYPNPTVGEIFVKPTVGVLTSEYGIRWEELHSGIDIADPSPNTMIVAAASGTVIRSYYSNSYGNCVFVTHNMNGKTYTTVYAHLENRTVETGQQVTQGQMIGYMGNTGHSFGKHLHFEIHEGEWNPKKSNSIDPKEYIKL